MAQGYQGFCTRVLQEGSRTTWYSLFVFVLTRYSPLASYHYLMWNSTAFSGPSSCAEWLFLALLDYRKMEKCVCISCIFSSYGTTLRTLRIFCMPVFLLEHASSSSSPFVLSFTFFLSLSLFLNSSTMRNCNSLAENYDGTRTLSVPVLVNELLGRT